MKSRGVLVLSLVINLGLLGAWGYLVKQPSMVAATAEPSGANGVSTANGAEGNSISNAVAAVKEKFSWGLLESPDYKKYIANLREVKCPEETVRDIIVADVDKLYAPRFAALQEPREEFKFWKRNNGWGRRRPGDGEKRKQMKALTDEKNALLKELLGVDAREARAGYSWWEDQQDEKLSFLSKEKRELLRKTQEKFQEEKSEIQFKAAGYYDEDTQADLKKVHKKELAEMAQYLTPEEIENYELRTSDLSQQLKRELKSIKPSEEEFQAIFKARSSSEEAKAAGADEPNAADARKKAAEARKDADQQMKELLGDERYTEYKRGNDYAYESLRQMGEYLGYDKTAAAKVYDMKAEVERQTRNVQSDKSLSAEQRAEKLKAIRAETEKAVIEQIGEKGLKAYKRGGGYWLGNISR